MKSDRIHPELFEANHSLFQRLLAPGRRMARPFGGGRSNLSPHAEQAVLGVFSWDYMGAAEFEHGEAGECLAYMHENAQHLEATEHNGFFFLTHREITTQAHALWDWLVGYKTPRHKPQFDNPEIQGWLDFKNGFFVGRTSEMRDALHKLMLEYVEP